MAAQRQAFATVLSYDGLAAWLPSNPADNAMRDVFNRHQQSDKGFGPAAGPGATDAIAAAFTQYGYRIVRGRSPWVVTAEHAELRRQVDAGWAAAVLETGLVPQSTVADWLAGREAAGAAAVTLVGHEDILCLPPDWRPDGPAARG